MRGAEKTIGTILDKQSTVYIGSVDEDGFPNTNTHSMRVSQYKQNPKANLYFCDKRFFRDSCW